MKQLGRLLYRSVRAAAIVSISFAGLAQKPAARLAGPLVGKADVVLPASQPPLAKRGVDAGALAPDTMLHGVTLVFSRSSEQEAALQTLLAAQQNPASPLYHQWLTPETFAAQFGVADADLAKVQSWLQAQGFSVDGIARSRNRISFSGTAGTLGTTFGTELHHFKNGNETHFAPDSDLSMPAALAPMVTAVLHLSDYRPKPQVRVVPGRVQAPDFTSSKTQEHFLTPKDVATMYDVTAEYNAGFNGAGQAVAIIGQSLVNTADIQNFQNAAGLATNVPKLVLVPGTGPSGYVDGDEGESDLDLEYASGMAPGANIFLVYVGDNLNYGVNDALTFAIDNNVAPVLSYSYGGCEPFVSTAQSNADNASFAQANAQGQTVVVASGDQGSTACFGTTDNNNNPEPAAFQEQLAVSYPASSPNVTAMGGTQMVTGASTFGPSQYWTTATGSDVVGSLLGYVPETVWNEDSSSFGIAAGGGGVSTIFARAPWQTGVPGIPAGTNRLLPDISLQASTGNPGYLYCTSDVSDLAQQGLTSGCANGFRDASGTYLSVAGGTSFATPIFAGLLAVLNQAKSATGQGNINPILYGLAGNTATYASAFHDITTGTNACTAGPSFCNALGASAYSAGVGYDEASGLGSIDFAHLVTAWPTSTAATTIGTTTTLSAATINPTSGATDAVTITVAGGTGTPTGTVTLTVDGNPVTPVLQLVNGTASYTYPGTAVTGAHVVVAHYSGDASHAPSTGTIALTVAVSNAVTGSFTLSATNLTVVSGSGGNSTITLTPVSGYVGIVNLAITSTLPANVCYVPQPLFVPGASVQAVSQEALTIVYGNTVCGAASARPGAPGAQAVPSKRASSERLPGNPWQTKPIAAAMLAFLAIGFAGRRRARLLPRLFALVLVAGLAGFGLTGCGGSTATPVTPPATTPTSFQVTLVGTDSSNPAVTASTTFTLTLTP